jgi:hypothetical protein
MPARGVSIQLAGEMIRIIRLAPELARDTVKSPEQAARDLMQSILNRIGFSITAEQAAECLEAYYGARDGKARPSSLPGS